MKNKEITIYELMGLIKDGKAPKKIKYDDVIYTLNFNRYYSSEEKDYLFDLFNRNFMDTDIPNIKVEILSEENDEWNDIKEIKLIDDSIEVYDDEKIRHLMNTNAKDRNIYIAKINQLIKNQKYLKERLDKDEQ